MNGYGDATTLLFTDDLCWQKILSQVAPGGYAQPAVSIAFSYLKFGNCYKSGALAGAISSKQQQSHIFWYHFELEALFEALFSNF